MDRKFVIPTRKSVVENYLSTFGTTEQYKVTAMADELRRDDLPVADTVALIPVAAHQEAPNIENALDQYALQQSRRPFTVMLYPNAPNANDLPAVERTMDEIEKSKRKHPDLDIRSTNPDIFYFGASIGTLRRSLWNAALRLSHDEGGFDNPTAEVIGLNHDIDLVRLSPRYIDRVQHRVDRAQKRYDSIDAGRTIPRMHLTQAKHAYDPTRPNIAKAVFWHDFSARQLRPLSGLDAGLVIPFSHYADRDGISEGARIGEMGQITQGKSIHVIPGTILETSPRRFTERLQSHELNQIWHGDESFSAHDAYRTDTTIPDISTIQLESVIINSLDESMSYFTKHALEEYRNDVTVNAMTATVEESMAILMPKLERRRRLAMTVLERYVQLPIAARMVESRYDIHKIADGIVND